MNIMNIMNSWVKGQFQRKMRPYDHNIMSTELDRSLGSVFILVEWNQISQKPLISL